VTRKKRRGDDDEWGEDEKQHTGAMMGGSIHELRTADPKGKPFPKRVEMGFCIDPTMYRRSASSRTPKRARPAGARPGRFPARMGNGRG
jgi:hypothetical protein